MENDRENKPETLMCGSVDIRWISAEDWHIAKDIFDAPSYRDLADLLGIPIRELQDRLEKIRKKRDNHAH